MTLHVYKMLLELAASSGAERQARHVCGRGRCFDSFKILLHAAGWNNNNQVFLSELLFIVPGNYNFIGAGVAQLVIARPSELEVPGLILGDSNVCFDFLLICVALALNTLKTEH